MTESEKQIANMKKDVADVQKSHKDFIQQSGENLADNMAKEELNRKCQMELENDIQYPSLPRVKTAICNVYPL